jgi:hypothetical protein
MQAAIFGAIFSAPFDLFTLTEVSMSVRMKALLGFGLLAIAPLCNAQYTMELTGVGNGTVANTPIGGVYVSPYVGTISGPGVSYSGYVICDDFMTDSSLNSPWQATTTSASALNGSERFGSSIMFDGTSYSAQQAYNAAGWLANRLLLNLDGGTAQENYAFAIWDLFDGQTINPGGGAQTLEAAALAAATGSNPYVANNVSVFTPSVGYTSQEFLVVNPAPEIDPSAATSALTLLLGGALVVRARRKQHA